MASPKQDINPQETSVSTNRVITFNRDLLKSVEALSESTGLSISEIVETALKNIGKESKEAFSKAIEAKAKRQQAALDSLLG